MSKNKIEDCIESTISQSKDSESYDDKFNKEMENRFTDLMNKARSTVVDEYRKNNSCLYSMTTRHNNNEITVVQAGISVLCDFEEKCNRIANEIGLKQFRIYKHKDESDISGIQVCEVFPLRGEFNRYIEKSFKSMLDCCDCVKDHFKNYVEIKKSCDDIRSRIVDLRSMVETEYIHSIDIAKQSME